MELQQRLDNLKIINNHYVINENKTITGNVFLDHKYRFMKEKFFDAIEGKRFLDIGCNGGYYVILAKQLGAREAIGVDVCKDYIDLARDVAKEVKVNVNFEQEPFSEYILRFGTFHAINLCSLYHYIYMSMRNHDAIFRILSLMTENLFFENPLGMDDPVVAEYVEKRGHEYLRTEYTKEKILHAAGKYFKCEFLSDHLYPARKIYWMTRKRGNFNINDLSSKQQVHEYRGHKYYAVTLPGIKRKFFLKHRLPIPNLSTNEIRKNIEICIDKLNHIPGIVICYDYFTEADNSLYIIMEHLTAHETLYACQGDRKPIVRQKVMNILSCLAKSGYMNADPSPLNFLCMDENVKMIDLDTMKPLSEINNPETLEKIMDLFKWY